MKLGRFFERKANRNIHGDWCNRIFNKEGNPDIVSFTNGAAIDCGTSIHGNVSQAYRFSDGCLYGRDYCAGMASGACLRDGYGYGGGTAVGYGNPESYEQLSQLYIYESTVNTGKAKIKYLKEVEEYEEWTRLWKEGKGKAPWIAQYENRTKT
jgi:hypothetical protein